MFCRNCGQEAEEGQAFCKACGASLAAVPPASTGAPSPQSVPPPGGYGYGYGYGGPQTGGQPPGGGPQPGGRGGLIAGIVAAIVIVLAGAGVGVYFGVFHERGEGPTTTRSTMAMVSTDTTVAGPASTTAGTTTSTQGGGTTVTTSAPNGTAQTIPSLHTTTSRPATSTTEDDLLTTYLKLTDIIVAELEAADARIPELATEINNTAPNVPARVRDELKAMLDTLDHDWVEFSLVGVPDGFEDSAYALDSAIDHMYNRIQATIDGIDVMRDTGKVSSANSYFDEGRTERDAYRAAMDDYYDVLPIE